MFYTLAHIYKALLLVTVTIHISIPSPTLKNPKNYGLGTCTGVFISPNEILTAGHCVADSRGRQWVKTNEGPSYAVVIEKLDVKTDLALLKINRPINHAHTSLGNPTSVTDRVYTVNSGEGFEATFNQGFVNNIILDEDTAVITIFHNASILAGASGSGLFNSNLELIGINIYTMKSFSGAVDMLEIRRFLNVRN